jgi:hypothetical protein
MRHVVILIIAFLISGCYTQLQTVKQDNYNNDYESSSYESDEAYETEEYETLDTTDNEEIHVYHHYYPGTDPYFDYLYYDDPFWYYHTGFYLGYSWPYTRWYRPIWHRPWWSWCYYCMDYYSPWYSSYYPYYYPWGAYDYYPYYSSTSYGKRPFSRRGMASTVAENRVRSRTDDEDNTAGIARKRSSTKKSEPDSRTRVSEPERKKSSAVKKRSKNSRSKTGSGTVTKPRSSTRPRSSGSSVRRSSPPRSAPSSGTRSSSGRSSTGSSRSSGKRR